MHILYCVFHYVAYLCGFGAQVLMQANSSIKSNSNGIAGIGQWMKVHSSELIPRLVIAFFLAPLVVTFVPDAGKLPISVLYFLGGFSFDRIASSLIFSYAPNGMKVDTPLVAPPNGNGKNGSSH